jgi:hypothetical protein
MIQSAKREIQGIYGREREIIMATEKKEFFTKVSFDDAAYATSEKEKMENKMRRSKIGMIAALVSMICGFLFLGEVIELPDLLINIISGIWLIALLAAYIIGGGFSLVLKTALKIAGIGWLYIPFPVNIFTGILTFAGAVFSLFTLPILYLLLYYIQLRMDYKAVNEYLEFCN